MTLFKEVKQAWIKKTIDRANNELPLGFFYDPYDDVILVYNDGEEIMRLSADKNTVAALQEAIDILTKNHKRKLIYDAAVVPIAMGLSLVNFGAGALATLAISGKFAVDINTVINEQKAAEYNRVLKELRNIIDAKDVAVALDK